MTNSAHWPLVLREGPLQGLKVLELSRILAGPLATMQLADLGADVIKVELPGRGDETRHWGPPYSPEGAASYFLCANRNKRSVELDLTLQGDLSVALELARQADVVVDNFMPGKLSELGLDYDAIRIDNPTLISATVSGFGEGNTYSGRPGFDFLAQAMGGLMSVTGHVDGPPTRVGVAVNDILAASYLTTGILTALARPSPKGRHIEVSLLDTQIAMLANLASGWLVSGFQPERFGNAHPNIAPYETFETADRPIAVAVGLDRQFKSLAQVLEIPELGDSPRYRSNADRLENRAKLREVLQRRLNAKPRDEWLALLETHGVPAAPINSLGEALQDPVVQERMLVTIDGSPQVRSAIRIDGDPLPVYAAPPSLGEDNLEIRTAVRGADGKLDGSR